MPTDLDVIRDRVRRSIDDRIGDVLQLTRDLVAAPSENLPGDETMPAEVVRQWLESNGMPKAETVAQLPHRPNLLVTLDSGRPGPRLGLCGHLDTKPVGDAG